PVVDEVVRMMTPGRQAPLFRRKAPIFASAVVALVLIAVACPGAAMAQESGKLPSIYEGAGLDEKLGATLPLDIVLYDESGTAVELGSLFPADRPVLLNFVYYNCPMLCSILLDGVTNALRKMEWTPGNQ